MFNIFGSRKPYVNPDFETRMCEKIEPKKNYPPRVNPNRTPDIFYSQGVVMAMRRAPDRSHPPSRTKISSSHTPFPHPGGTRQPPLQRPDRHNPRTQLLISPAFVPNTTRLPQTPSNDQKRPLTSQQTTPTFLGHTPHNTAQPQLHPPHHRFSTHHIPNAHSARPAAPNQPTTILHSVPPPPTGLTRQQFSLFVISLILINPLLLVPTSFCNHARVDISSSFSVTIRALISLFTCTQIGAHTSPVSFTYFRHSQLSTLSSMCARHFTNVRSL